jgi:hypothetical protein
MVEVRSGTDGAAGETIPQAALRRPGLTPLIYWVFVAVCMSLSAVDRIRTARRENTSS